MATKQLFTILLFTLSFAASAQDYNPYKSIGKKAKILTLSKGKYLEFFDLDSIQRIGTVMYNIRTHKIVKLLNAAEVYKKASNNTSASRWYSPDPLADKFASFSPYNFVENNPINKIDPTGLAPEDIIVTTKGGKELFRLDDGKKEITSMTAKQLYAKGTQWFEPLADNYMPLKSVSNDISTTSELKHFTWGDIDNFASEDRWMTSYRQGGSGDWKKSEKGADGYLMVTVNGQPYWSDAVGQIPFAVDYFTDRLGKHNNSNQAIHETIAKGRSYGEGKLIGGKTDNSNTYDNYFLLRGALYASDKYKKMPDGVRSYNVYIPDNMGDRIWYKDAIPYLGLNPKK